MRGPGPLANMDSKKIKAESNRLINKKWAKERNKWITEKEIQVAIKHTKRCSTLLLIR